MDQNANSIPDEWELFYYGGLLAAGEENLDSDVDTMSEYDEYIAGTDPTDQLDHLKINRLAVATTMPALAWSGVKNYRVQYTDGLSQAWQQDDTLGHYTRVDIGGGAFDWTYNDPQPLAGGSRFYRVVIVPSTDPRP